VIGVEDDDRLCDCAEPDCVARSAPRTQVVDVPRITRTVIFLARLKAGSSVSSYEPEEECGIEEDWVVDCQGG
jgi:hypothetical protein